MSLVPFISTSLLLRYTTTFTGLCHALCGPGSNVLWLPLAQSVSFSSVSTVPCGQHALPSASGVSPAGNQMFLCRCPGDLYFQLGACIGGAGEYLRFWYFFFLFSDFACIYRLLAENMTGFNYLKLKLTLSSAMYFLYDFFMQGRLLKLLA